MKLLRFLKHVFIPHEHNDYKPHFFREVSIAILLAVSIFLLGVSFGSSFFIHRTVLGANVTASVLIDLTNESRLAYNEAPLVRSSLLDQAATLKAEDMVKEGYFAHDSPTGVTPWHWLKEVGYVFLYAGENLAVNFTDASAVRDAWLASPKHRENLLDVKFKEIGMATLGGTYKNGPTIYVVQMFGTPATPITKVEPVPQPEKVSEVEAVPVSTSKTQVVVQNDALPEIKGDTAAEYEPIVTTDDLAIVKNTSGIEPIVYEQKAPQYSTWYERLIFSGSYYVQWTLIGLLALITVALIAMVVIEIRRQHWKHIAYGLSIALVVVLCLLINQAFF